MVCAAIAALAVVILATASQTRTSHALGAPVFAKPTAAARALPKARFLTPRGQEVSEHYLAANARGDVAAVWQAAARRGHDKSYFRYRPAGGHWSRVRGLTPGHAYSAATQPAVAPDGTVLLFWSRSTWANPRSVQRRLTVWHPGEPFRSRPLPHGLEVPNDIAFAPDGTAIATWTHWNRRRVQVRTAVRRPHGAWSSPQVVSSGKRNMSDPQVAVDGAGNATLVWERWPAGVIERDQPASPGDEQYQIRAAFRPAGGRFGKPQLLSNPRRDATAAFLAVGARGDVAVLWASETFNYVADRIGFTVREPGDRFRGPRWLTRPGHGGSAAAAIDPAGNMSAVWEEWRPCGHGYRRCAHLLTARRPPGGHFGPPARIGAAEFHPAFDSHGNTVLIRTSPGSKRNGFRGRVEGRFLSANGVVGPRRRFSTVGLNDGATAALADNGVATITWERLIRAYTSKAYDRVVWIRTRVRP
jgi:hypothetical protein